MNNTACASPEDEPERDARVHFIVPLGHRDETWRLLLLAPAVTIALLLAVRLILHPATSAVSLLQTAKDGFAAIAIAAGIILWTMRAWGFTRLALTLLALGVVLSFISVS